MKKEYRTVSEFIKDHLSELYKGDRIAAELLIKYGKVTKFQLEEAGIGNPSRIMTNLKDRGIPIVDLPREKVRPDRNKVAVYALGDIKDLHPEKINRKVYEKKQENLKSALINRDGLNCKYCQEFFIEDDLEVHHRLPVSEFGDLKGDELFNPDNFYLVCKNCNRAIDRGVHEDCQDYCFQKENGEYNWERIKSCYWYDPDNYTHIGAKQVRSIMMTWIDDEVKQYDQLQLQANKAGLTMQNYLKQLILR